MSNDVKPASRAFQERILNDLLPIYCNDPSRGWDVAGFEQDWSKIRDVDAADFIRGMDQELVRHEGRGLYRAPKSRAREQFFWPGSKMTAPRRITLWVEPIITIAVVARLHFDLGWRKELIGTQSIDWAFDVTTYLSTAAKCEHIACEVKKSVPEVEQLVERMIEFGKVPSANLAPKGKHLNAFKKLQALRSRQPPLFWAVGPGGASWPFRMDYREDGEVDFQEIAVHELGYDLWSSTTASALGHVSRSDNSD